MAAVRAHALCHLLLPTAAPMRLEMPRRPLDPLDRSPLSLPRVPHSLARPERSSSPPFAATVTTVVLSPLSRVQKLHDDVKLLHAEDPDPKSTVVTPSSSSSTSGTTDHRRRFATSGATPSPLTFCAASL